MQRILVVLVILIVVCVSMPSYAQSSSSSGGGGSSSSGGSGSGSSSGAASTGSDKPLTDGFFGSAFASFTNWLKDVLLYVPKWCWQELLSAFSALINAIPVPSWFSTFSSGISGAASDVVWWLDLFQFKAGVGMISAALLARFLLRRIPFIG